MEAWLCLMSGGMALFITVLLVKIRLIQKSAEEIERAFADRLVSDTNALIDISSGDQYMRSLADTVNAQLRVLRAERRRFRQGDQELKNAVTNISHDLRTPLTAICAYLDLLDREETGENARRYLEQIRNRTEALGELTEELFRYSIVTSSQELKTEHINIVNILEENLLSFYEMMREKGIRPQIKLPETPVWRELDAGALNRVFSNITGNALKYTDGDFSVEMEESGSITFSNTAEALNPLIVGQLFDRFYTVETGRSSTGLGLSIAKLLTERMGGQIRADYIDKKLSITVKL